MSRRMTVCVLLFGLTALAVTTQQPGTATAQKVNPQVAQLQQQNQVLRNEVTQLQAQLKQAEARLWESQAASRKAVQPNRPQDIAGLEASLAQSRANLQQEESNLISSQAARRNMTRR